MRLVEFSSQADFPFFTGESKMARFRFGLGVALLAAASGIGWRVDARRQSSEPARLTQDSATQDAATQQQETGNAPARAKVTVNAVFAAGAEFVDAVKATCQDFHSDKLQDCFAQQMKKAKASAAAVEFSKELGEPGFVRDFKSAGPVNIAYVLYPYRANENQSCLIVNGDPATVDVDNHKLVSVETLKRNATYLTLAKTHKEISLWPGDRYETETPDVEMATNAGAHIVVNYRLREQCHACAVLGHAWFSFDFDPKGKFQGAKLMRISVSHFNPTPFRKEKKDVLTAVGEEFTIALPVAAAAAAPEWTLAAALDSGKLRLIEHSAVAPTGNGEVGRDELWKFAAFGTGTTEIAFQKSGAKDTEAQATMKFKVVVLEKPPQVSSKKNAAQ